MRLYDLANAIMEKFAPISKQDNATLQKDVVTEYAKVNTSLQDKITRNQMEKDKKAADPNYVPQLQSLTALEKAIKFCEQWWFRYILAFASVFIIRAIQNWLSSAPGDGDEDGDEEMDEYQSYLEWKRFNKRN